MVKDTFMTNGRKVVWVGIVFIGIGAMLSFGLMDIKALAISFVGIFMMIMGDHWDVPTKGIKPKTEDIKSKANTLQVTPKEMEELLVAVSMTSQLLKMYNDEPSQSEQKHLHGLVVKWVEVMAKMEA